MTVKKVNLMLSAAAVALLMASPAEAERVRVPGEVITTTTIERTVLAPGTRVYKLSDVDVDGDGMLSRADVGKFLFKLYDTDGNMVIDNIEYERPLILTVLPVERETIVTYDLNGDGTADGKEVTYEVYMRETMLSRFSKNEKGLSAHDFTGKTFRNADINKNHFVDIKEWEATYNEALNSQLQRDAEYNRR